MAEAPPTAAPPTAAPSMAAPPKAAPSRTASSATTTAPAALSLTQTWPPPGQRGQSLVSASGLARSKTTKTVGLRVAAAAVAAAQPSQRGSQPSQRGTQPSQRGTQASQRGPRPAPLAEVTGWETTASPPASFRANVNVVTPPPRSPPKRQGTKRLGVKRQGSKSEAVDSPGGAAGAAPTLDPTVRLASLLEELVRHRSPPLPPAPSMALNGRWACLDLTDGWVGFAHVLEQLNGRPLRGLVGSDPFAAGGSAHHGLSTSSSHHGAASAHAQSAADEQACYTEAMLAEVLSTYDHRLEVDEGRQRLRIASAAAAGAAEPDAEGDRGLRGVSVGDALGAPSIVASEFYRPFGGKTPMPERPAPEAPPTHGWSYAPAEPRRVARIDHDTPPRPLTLDRAPERAVHGWYVEHVALICRHGLGRALRHRTPVARSSHDGAGEPPRRASSSPGHSLAGPAGGRRAGRLAAADVSAVLGGDIEGGADGAAPGAESGADPRGGGGSPSAATSSLGGGARWQALGGARRQAQAPRPFDAFVWVDVPRAMSEGHVSFFEGAGSGSLLCDGVDGDGMLPAEFLSLIIESRSVELSWLQVIAC